jgi:hypothetical protein
MEFEGTPMNMTTLLVAALAMVAVVVLLRKRYDSNLPLLFYFIALLFTNMSDREVNPFVLYGGLAFALLLRFEFLNRGFGRIVAFFATTAICLIIYSLVATVFNDGSPPF